MAEASQYIAKTFIWGVVSKVLDAIIKFVSVSLLIKFFGKDNYALVSLAMSVNAYMQLFDMGVNVGAVKYFSEWIGAGKQNLLSSVARTSLTFYATIGLANSIILVLVAFFGVRFFSLSIEQSVVLRNLFFVLSFFSVVNWCTSVFNQLLTANEQFYYIQQINIVKSVLNLLVIIATLHYKLDVLTYFTYFTFVNTLVIIPFYLKSKQFKLIESFRFGSNWGDFKPIFKYSLAIILMGIFQTSAVQLRPVFLGIFSNKGIGIVTDFRVMETITVFVISIGGMFTSIFLPRTSKLYSSGDRQKLADFAYEATLYTSIVCVVLCFPFILTSKEILISYVGTQYAHLSRWLMLWMFVVLLSLHNSPVYSVIIASGKTKMLVYSTAIACVLSLFINAILCQNFGAGSAVIGYALYVIIQMSFTYLYFNKYVLGFDSFRIFRSFLVPFSLGTTAFIIVWVLNIDINIKIFQILAKSLIWGLLFALQLIAFRIISIENLKKVVKGSKI